MFNHKGTNTIETIRLILRRFEMEDARDMFYNWGSDSEVCKFLPWGPYRKIEAVESCIRYWINNYNRDNYYNWAIYLKKQEAVVGTISVEVFNEKGRSCEIGYCLGSKYWNYGIMTEALRAVIHYMLCDIGCEKVIARHDILNVASGRVMEKAGMKFKKKIPSSIRKDGTYSEVAIYEKRLEIDS